MKIDHLYLSSLKNSVTVKEALQKARFQLLYLGLVIIIVPIIGAVIGSWITNSVYWFWLIALALPMALLQWSYCVVRWKVWAYPRVDNIHLLYIEAIRHQLIWPIGSFLKNRDTF